ncbi:hypothetical protein PPROV_000373400 [Pycnococcus provasolii]|uniref:Uncharacterized protein n=2 Tax=Pycnococcus provasolii TaxID=41880 RepID=A0A830HE60_9CHLO|nr:hypothetical protein PPROV_000373400 [Pycnococcus provasolii]|mmetsp:Transcript_1117/g.3107  ORF Transcript_1117/g.3107 Transcript_1117/m.3107 type:complete len:141 (-) Transcript_1117:9-431(-)
MEELKVPCGGGGGFGGGRGGGRRGFGGRGGGRGFGGRGRGGRHGGRGGGGFGGGRASHDARGAGASPPRKKPRTDANNAFPTTADASGFFKASMLQDPWRHLEKTPTKIQTVEMQLQQHLSKNKPPPPSNPPPPVDESKQ